MNWIYSLFHREKRKNKNFDPELIQQDIRERQAAREAASQALAEKTAMRILDRLARGKYKVRINGDVDVWIGDPDISIGLVNEVLRPHGVQLAGGFYAASGTTIRFIRDTNHPLGRGRLSE